MKNIYVFPICFFVVTNIFSQPLPAIYHSYDEIVDSLLVLEAQYPSYLDVFSIGYSTNDSIPIYVAKVSDNAPQYEDEPRLLIIGQVHAEENIGVELVLDMVSEMVMQHNSSPWNFLVPSSEIYFIPSLNPEGLDVVTDNLDITYRKNKRDNIGDGIFRYIPEVGYDTSGVDLNRNFSLNWIRGDTLFQMQTYELYDYYRGAYPFSENETSAIKTFAEEKRFAFGIIYHQSRTGNVSENVIYPWNWDESGKFPPDFDAINNVGLELASLLHQQINPGQSYEPHPSTGRSGNAHDWFYSALNCYLYTIETSDIQPADSTVLYGIINDNEEGVEFLIRRAISDGANISEAGQLTGKIYDAVTGTPLEAEVKIIGRTSGLLQPRYSEPVFGRFRFYLIHGTYTLEVSKQGYTTLDSTFFVNQSFAPTRILHLNPLPYHTIQGIITDFASGLPVEAVLYFAGNAWDTVQTLNGEFNLQLPESQYQLRVDAEDYISHFESFDLYDDRILNCELFLGDTVIFENFENGAGLWTFGGEPGWGIDYAVRHSGIASLGDSPGGEYTSNLNSWAQLAVDLSGYTSADLSFWNKYYLEPEYDFGIVEVSIDGGVNWEELAQFDLQNIDWYQERLNLTLYCQNQILLRFRLDTDANLNEAGWNIDDILILGSDVNQVEVPNFPAVLGYRLGKSYPNPFNTSVIFEFNLKSAGYVDMKAYNILGEEIASIISADCPRGFNSVKWNAEEFPSGIYFIRIQAGDWQAWSKVLLLK